ncbi:hypothetical protein DZF79_28520 [Vibrio parahaemolyticus]|nr:hypothetical protein [Vibrio parahaemolyticus]
MTIELITPPAGFEYVNKNRVETNYDMKTLIEFAEDEFYGDLEWFYQAHDNGNGTTCLIRRPKTLLEVLQVVEYEKVNYQNITHPITFEGNETYEVTFNQHSGELSIKQGKSVGWYLLSKEQLSSAKKSDDGSWLVQSNRSHPHKLEIK